jgi:DNA processing protein
MIIPGADARRIADVLRFSLADLGVTNPRKVEELRKLGDIDLVNEEWGVTGDLASFLRRVESWWDHGYGVSTILDATYPELLREVREAPALVFSEGLIVPEETGVSVVGSRNATPAELEAARETAGALVSRGLPVISGLAAGIDAAAHAGAMDAGGRTVAVMGTGLDHTYPAENRALRSRIVDTGGLVLSSFLPEARGSKQSFPMRNAVMSGYGVATIVIAAGEKSGTRHQAHAAVRHGRGVILTGKTADTVSWARALVERGVAQVAHSPVEAADMAVRMLSVREQDLVLF